jgi:AAA+ ATPase superfamily predicted ATPase
MKFVNRQAEISYLFHYFTSEPNALLFVYGPKSSGKTALLNQVIMQLEENQYVINFLDLWEIQQMLQKRRQGWSVNQICEFFVNDKFGKVYEFLRKMDQEHKSVLLEVLVKIVSQQFCAPTEIHNPIILDELLKTMVAHDFWFYKVDGQKITANSQSMYWAFEKMVRLRKE